MKKHVMLFQKIRVLIPACILALFLAGGCSSLTPVVPLNKTFPTLPMELPEDLKAHDWAQTEWWYYTGHLEDEAGESYGFELCIFRRRLDEDKAYGLPLIRFARVGYMGHFAITRDSDGTHRYASQKRLYREDTVASYDTYRLDFKGWTMEGDNRRHQIRAAAKEIGLDLTLDVLKPPVPHLKGGIVPKGNGMGNYYVSYTRLGVTGTISVGGEEKRVTGSGWFDHEYGQMGASAVAGWDWFSIQTKGNTEYMIYILKQKQGGISPASMAYRIRPDGTEESVPFSAITFTPLGVWVSPETGGRYPSSWHIVYKPWGLDMVVVPTVASQEFIHDDISYWEGRCRVVGKPEGGQAYAELVGYTRWEKFEKSMAKEIEETLAVREE